MSSAEHRRGTEPYAFEDRVTGRCAGSRQVLRASDAAGTARLCVIAA